MAEPLERRLRRELADPGRFQQAVRLLALVALFMGTAVLVGWSLLALVAVYSRSFEPLLNPPPMDPPAQR